MSLAPEDRPHPNILFLACPVCASWNLDFAWEQGFFLVMCKQCHYRGPQGTDTVAAAMLWHTQVLPQHRRGEPMTDTWWEMRT